MSQFWSLGAVWDQFWTPANNRSPTMYEISTDFGQFGSIFEQFWHHFEALFGIIFRTSFLEASWHAFWSIWGPFCGQVGSRKQQKTFRGRSNSRFVVFRSGSLSEAVSGSVLEAFWAQKAVPKRVKNGKR